MARLLRQNTAVTVVIGQFMNWADGKTPLYSALGGNANFDPTKLVCTLTKGSTQSTHTLSKTGGDNDMNLLADSQATLELTAGNTDTCGHLLISFINATAGQEVILEGKVFEFFVVDEEYYDTLIGTDQLTVNLSTQAALDVHAECADAISDAALATEANATLNKATILAEFENIPEAGDATAANQQTIINALGNIPTKADKPSIS